MHATTSCTLHRALFHHIQQSIIPRIWAQLKLRLKPVIGRSLLFTLPSPENIESTAVHYHGATEASQPRNRVSRRPITPYSTTRINLIAYINKLTARGTPPTNSIVKTFALKLAYKRPGKNWLSRFI